MEEPMNEAPEDEIDWLNNAGHSLRYEMEVRNGNSPSMTADFRISSSPSPSAPPTSVTSRERAWIAELEADVLLLRPQLETANSQFESTLGHLVCAGWEIKSLKERLNFRPT